jgi:hypothetical protein
LSGSTSTKADPKTSTKRSAPALPSELWDRVFHYLPVDDIKSVRLVWRLWTDIGSRYLFVPFIFQSDRSDFERFELISRAPALLSGIRSFQFDIGTMSIAWAATQLGLTYFFRTKEPGIDHEKEISLEEYGAWNVRWHNAAQSYQKVATLSKVFERVNFVDDIKFVYKSTPFETELLLEAWAEESLADNMRKHTKEFTTVLLALKKAKKNLKSLSHDQLPVVFFAMESSRLTSLCEPLKHLRRLHLTFHATQPPHVIFWQGLGLFLRAMPNLSNLRFGFVPSWSYFSERGIWQWSESTARDWYIPLWRITGSYTWKNLEKLQLDGLMVCETGLNEFLCRHASTLRTLILSNIGLWQGSFQSLLFALKNSFSLKAFRIQGFLRAFHVPHEAWKFARDPMFRPEVEDWKFEFASFIKDKDSEFNKMSYIARNLSSPDIRHSIEQYMFSAPSEPWPIRPADTLERFRPGSEWPVEHDAIKCHDCVLNQEQANMNWDIGLSKPIAGWADYNAKELRGVGEKRIVNFFRRGGFDKFGFNVKGYDRFSTHYSDVLKLADSEGDDARQIQRRLVDATRRCYS